MTFRDVRLSKSQEKIMLLTRIVHQSFGLRDHTDFPPVIVDAASLDTITVSAGVVCYLLSGLA